MDVPTTPEALSALARIHPALLVLYTEGGCRVADAVEDKLSAQVRERFPRVEQVVIAREQAPALLAQQGVFVFPTVVLYFDGREGARFVRTFPLGVVMEAIARPYELLWGG